MDYTKQKGLLWGYMQPHEDSYKTSTHIVQILLTAIM